MTDTREGQLLYAHYTQWEADSRLTGAAAHKTGQLFSSKNEQEKNRKILLCLKSKLGIDFVLF